MSHAGRGYPRYGPKARQGGLLPQQPAATATATRRTAHCKQPGHPEQQPQAPSRQCRESGPRHAGQDDATARPGGTCAHRSAECAGHLCAEDTPMSRLCHRSRQARYGCFPQALNSLKEARSARLQPNGAAKTAPVLSKQLRRSEGVFGPEKQVLPYLHDEKFPTAPSMKPSDRTPPTRAVAASPIAARSDKCDACRDLDRHRLSRDVSLTSTAGPFVRFGTKDGKALVWWLLLLLELGECGECEPP